MFHHFHREGSRPTGPGSLTEETFKQILGHIGAENIIKPSDWIDKIHNNKLKDTDCCLTFDDALKCQLEIAVPLLEKYDLQAFWFIYSSVFQGELERMELYRTFMTKYFDDFELIFHVKSI